MALHVCGDCTFWLKYLEVKNCLPQHPPSLITKEGIWATKIRGEKFDCDFGGGSIVGDCLSLRALICFSGGLLAVWCHLSMRHQPEV
jgi:hypothetical protein